jgi:hypothetical protein
MDVVPPFLAVLLACYVVGATFITATKILHELRDLSTGVRKIEEGDRLGKLRVRIAALQNSFIPIWRGICLSAVFLAIILGLCAYFLDKTEPETKPKTWVSISLVSIDAQSDTKPNTRPNPWVSAALLIIGAVVSFGCAVTYFRAGGQDVKVIQESIESEMNSALSHLSSETFTATPESKAAPEKLSPEQLAKLPYCVLASDRSNPFKRRWRRFWAEMRYATWVFFCGLELIVCDVQRTPQAAVPASVGRRATEGNAVNLDASPQVRQNPLASPRFRVAISVLVHLKMGDTG